MTDLALVTWTWEHDGGAASLPLSWVRGPIRRRDQDAADQSEARTETLKTIYEGEAADTADTGFGGERS